METKKRHIAGDKFGNLILISLNFVPKCPIDNMHTLNQIKAWHWSGVKNRRMIGVDAWTGIISTIDHIGIETMQNHTNEINVVAKKNDNTLFCSRLDFKSVSENWCWRTQMEPAGEGANSIESALNEGTGDPKSP